MRVARESLPQSVGQQDVIVFVCETNPELNRLTYATRWRNAWVGRVADPEFTMAVEKAAEHFKAQHKQTANRLRRQGLTRPK